MTNDIVTTPEAATTSSISSIGSEGLHEFIRYGVASALALTTDTATLWFLTSIIGIPYLLSGAIAFVVGLIMIYILSVYWVFARRAFENRWIEFLVFSLIGLVGLAINEAILYFLTSVFGFFYLVSKLASVAFVFTWNFAARKWLLFRVRTNT